MEAGIIILMSVPIVLYFCWCLASGSGLFEGIKKSIDKYKDEILKKEVSDKPLITFEQFKSFYAVNPDKWICHGCYVSYGREIHYDLPGYGGCTYGKYPVSRNENNIPFVVETKYTDIGFKTKTDLKRYKKWKREQENARKREIANKTYTLILEDVQKDVQKRMEEIKRQQEEDFARIEAERRANEKKYAKCITNSTSSDKDTSALLLQPIITFDELKQEVIQQKQDLLELVPFSREGINFMYEGNLCELFVQKGSGDIYVKMPDNDFRLLREITPTPLIYFKEQDAHLLKDIEKDLDKEWK